MAVEGLGSRGDAAGVHQAEAAEHQHDGGGDERADRGDTGDYAHGPESVGVEQQALVDGSSVGHRRNDVCGSQLC
jgi:hypothetical protein